MKTLKPVVRLKHGFTLIEMLVVIGIIAILATIAIPTGNIVLKKARELQAKTAMKGLEIAIKGYQTEYNRYPLADAEADDTKVFDTSEDEGLNLLRALMAQDTTTNPRRIRFYDPPAAKNNMNGFDSTAGALYDPWGAGYKIQIDYDGDGVLTDPYEEGKTLSSGVVIYSSGADKAFSEAGATTKTDDIKSWQ